MTNPLLYRFRDMHRGEACVIVCNGPSLNSMDLGFLKHKTVIGLNKIHLGLDRFGFQPKYLVSVNARVVQQSGAEMLKIPAVKFIGARAAEYLPASDSVYHVPVLGPPVTFSRDISMGLREGGTVTHAALQIAYFMGFDEVAIIGMDHRFTYDGQPHEARLMSGADPNHFSPDYFRGQVWDNPDLRRSEESYAVARAIFEASGRKVVDATVNGACQVFAKVGYQDYFGLPASAGPSRVLK